MVIHQDDSGQPTVAIRHRGFLLPAVPETYRQVRQPVLVLGAHRFLRTWSAASPGFERTGIFASPGGDVC